MNRRTLFLSVLLLLCSLLAPLPEAEAGPDPKALAEEIARELGKKFRPDQLTVTTDGSTAYVEARGAWIDKIRIDSLRLEATLKPERTPVSGDADALAGLIASSVGELTLLEKDVNGYFAKNEESGFTGLHFDFTPSGFQAKGVYSATFLFTFRIRLAATGVLALRPEGIILDQVAMFVEGLKQPDSFTARVVSSVNPLLEFRDIPFPVTFKRLTMTEAEVTLTGGPKRLDQGATAVWKRPQP